MMPKEKSEKPKEKKKPKRFCEVCKTRPDCKGCFKF